MNKRGKATLRAVSPDIVSLSTNSAKKNAGKGKGKNGKTEKTGEEQQQQQQELQDSVVFNNNETHEEIQENIKDVESDIVKDSEMEAEGIKKKRGRPKKNLPVGGNILSPDIVNPTDGAGGRKNLKKGKARKKLIEEAEESVQDITPLPPSPEVPLGSEETSFVPAGVNSNISNSHVQVEANLRSPDVASEQCVEPVISTSLASDNGAVLPAEVAETDRNVQATESPQTSSIFGGTNLFERKYKPGFIPGLDVEEAEENSSKAEGNNLSFGSVMAKKVLNMEKQQASDREPKSDEKIEKFDDSDNKIRRSSRIKTLEETRGPRKRREVVFYGTESAASSRSQSAAGDEDSNSNSSLIMNGEMQFSNCEEMGEDSNRSQTDFNSLGLSSVALSFINMLPPSSNASSSNSVKPLKVKSRWRYSLDAELKSSESSLDSSSLMASREPLADTSNVAPPVTAVTFRPVSPPLGPTMVKKPGFIVYDSTDEELTEKLKKFDGIEDSVFFTERKVSKESKYMVCDCYLSKDDIQRGEVGCNEDCLNRLLMVECGSRCPTGDRCTNRKFQRKEYCKLEVFKTDKKGHGLRTLVPVPAGGFVIEYVGEVLSPRGFAQRTKEYAKEKQEHFYFMALRSDTIIDATQKGNCSRFINHSCEPNCETQKWTVNGELRVGFFAQRDLEAGEEITFDYQFQRYGKKAQKCYCLSEKCRGWIGGEEEEAEEDDGENKEPEIDDFDLEVEERKPKVKAPRRKKKQAISTRNEFGDRFDEELATLEKSGLKNRNHTLALCRLMVRAEDWDAREKLLTILTNGDQPCRRLFLDYHGLRLLHGWMSALPLPTSDNSNNLIKNDSYHLLFLKALSSLPIPNKTMLNDSQVLSLVEKWSEINPIREIKAEIKPEATQEECVEIKAETESVAPPAEGVQNEEVIASEVEIKIEPEVAEVNSADDIITEVAVNTSEISGIVDNIKPLQEEIKLDTPKEEVAVEQVASAAEHLTWDFVDGAKRLMQDWSDLKEVFRIPKKERVQQMKEHEREADKGVVAPPLKESKESTYDRDSRTKSSRKNERRVPTLDSYLAYKRSMRDYQSQYANMTKEERRIMFAKQVAEREKEEAKQREMQDNMVVLHQERCKMVNLDPATTPIVDPSGVYYLDPATITWKEINLEDPAVPPELLLLIHGAIYPGMPMPDQGIPMSMLPPEETPENSFPPWPEGFPPPPPLPPPKLPSGWHIAHDPDGRFYYYHQESMEVRWVIPSPESSDASDLSSSEDSSDSEDLDVEDESVDLANAEDGSNVNAISEVEKVSKGIERRERRKLSGLVQERIISPRSEDDKPLLSQKAIRARKLELMAEKLHGVCAEDMDEDVNEQSVITNSSIENQEGVEEVTTDANHHDDGAIQGPMEKKRKVMLSDEGGGNGLNESDAGELEGAVVSTDIGTDNVVGANEVRNNDSSVTSPNSSTQLSTDSLLRPSTSVTKSGPSKSSEKKRLHKKNKKSLDKAEIARRLKEKKSSEEYFRNQIANVIVQNLNPYRKTDTKNGPITSNEDFKHLARKLTHMVTTKEVKHCKNAKTLVVNDSVKHKTKEFVKKYMGKFAGRTYAPSPPH